MRHCYQNYENYQNYESITFFHNKNKFIFIMSLKEIKELVSYLNKTGLQEVKVETEGFKLEIKRNLEASVQAIPAPIIQPPVTQATPVAQAVVQDAPIASVAVANPTETPAPASSKATNTHTITAPIVGTFYASPNPGSPNFVKLGDTVSKGQVVCIIEAMKLFNEIESEVSGKVVEILVDDANPVEFAQELFVIELS